MIQYHGNQETIHFANWLLHSGYVNLDTLEADTIKWTGQREYDECRLYAIADYLQSIVLDLVEQLTGVSCGTVDDLDSFDNYTEPRAFSGYPIAALIVPWLAEVANGIAYGTVAELVLAHREGREPGTPLAVAMQMCDDLGVTAN